MCSSPQRGQFRRAGVYEPRPPTCSSNDAEHRPDQVGFGLAPGHGSRPADVDRALSQLDVEGDPFRVAEVQAAAEHRDAAARRSVPDRRHVIAALVPITVAIAWFCWYNAATTGDWWRVGRMAMLGGVRHP